MISTLSVATLVNNATLHQNVATIISYELENTQAISSVAIFNVNFSIIIDTVMHLADLCSLAT